MYAMYPLPILFEPLKFPTGSSASQVSELMTVDWVSINCPETTVEVSGKIENA
jgi:hypothetical protein